MTAARSTFQVRFLLSGALAACGMCFVPSALGQATPESFINQQRMLEDSVREALDKEIPADRKVNIDYGGWFSFYTFLWDDGINSSRTYRQYDARIWGSASLDEGAHQFYARLKLQFHDFNHGDSFDGNEDDWVGPNLDRGFYQFDLKQAVKAYQKENLDWNLKFKIGRDLVQFGTGYALWTPLDHILITGEIGKFEIQGLGGMAIRSTDDFDRSRPNYSDSERNFWGTQITYKGFDKHRPFVYAFWNNDQHSENRFVPLQNWDYDSWYVGTGSAGELIDNLRYSTELVFEGGDNYGWHDWLQRDDICAWAYDVNLEYFWQRPMKPRTSFEYMFASGDGNRQFSPTNTIGGNTRGNDSGFNGFGYRDTGLSFAPRLSNVHIWRVGAAFVPFENISWLRQLELGTDWFLYWKNQAHGAVSDGTANQRAGYLGWEMDYYANWRITSDLAWTARFGTFFPGSAFSDQTTRTFFLVGITWSF